MKPFATYSPDHPGLADFFRGVAAPTIPTTALQPRRPQSPASTIAGGLFDRDREQRDENAQRRLIP